MKKLFLSAALAFGLVASASAASLSEAVFSQNGVDYQGTGQKFSAYGDTVGSTKTAPTYFSSFADVDRTTLTTIVVVDWDTLTNRLAATSGTDSLTTAPSFLKLTSNNNVIGLTFTTSGSTVTAHLMRGDTAYASIDIKASTGDKVTLALRQNNSSTLGVLVGEDEYQADGKTTAVTYNAGGSAITSLNFSRLILGNEPVDGKSVPSTLVDSIMSVYSFQASYANDELNTLMGDAARAAGSEQGGGGSGGSGGGSETVPEPTTATLSLLALAGLAARRRRK